MQSTEDKTYSINFKENKKRFCLSFHYKGANSYLFVSGKEIIKFKANDPFFISRENFRTLVRRYYEKTGLSGHAYD